MIFMQQLRTECPLSITYLSILNIKTVCIKAADLHDQASLWAPLTDDISIPLGQSEGATVQGTTLSEKPRWC